MVYHRNISFRELLSEMCSFLSGNHRCCLATLALVFLLVSFPSSLTSSQPSALTLPLSPHDIVKPSKFVLANYHHLCLNAHHHCMNTSSGLAPDFLVIPVLSSISLVRCHARTFTRRDDLRLMNYATLGLYYMLSNHPITRQLNN